jgi:hypothetical protein
MAHSAPDWSDALKSGYIYRVDDMAELAVRLGSIVNYDRRGEVLFAEGFESSLSAWSTSAGGTGASVAIDTTKSWQGSQSVKLVGGNTLLDVSSLDHITPYSVAGGFGVEVSYYALSATLAFELTLIVYDGSNRREYTIQIETISGAIWALGAGDSLVSITPAANVLIDVANGWNRVKLVLDVDAAAYKRLLINNQSWDLSAYVPYTLANALPPFLHQSLLIRSGLASNQSLWVDNAILTQNEE